MSHGRVVALVSGALALMLARPAAADIVNVISVISVAPEEGLTGSLTGAIDARRGRVSRLVVSAAPVLRYRHHSHLFITYGSGEYDQDNETVNRLFGHMRYRYRVTPRVIGEVFTQHETNPGVEQAYRGLVGAGPLFNLLERKHGRVALGVAYMLEYERIEDELPEGVVCPPGCTADPGLQHRISSYLTANYQLDTNLQLVETLYVQPLVTDPASDFRLLNDIQIAVLVTKYLSFNTTLSWIYDRAPNPTIYEHYDITLKSALTVQF